MLLFISMKFWFLVMTSSFDRPSVLSIFSCKPIPEMSHCWREVSWTGTRVFLREVAYLTAAFW